MKAQLPHAFHPSPTSPPAPNGPLMHRILVPLDSDTDLAALGQAVSLAEATRASIHLLHVIEPDPVMLDFTSMPVVEDPHVLARESAVQLAGLAERWSEPWRPISSAVHIGKPSGTILAVADGMAADFVVMGTHARRGVEHFVLGSVAEHVLREARCPILIVRERSREESLAWTDVAPLRFAKILVAVDFSDCSKRSLDYALRFARSFGGRVTLLHLVHPGNVTGTFMDPDVWSPGLLKVTQSSAEAQMRALEEETNGSTLIEKAVVKVGDPAEEIAAYAAAGKFDLVVCSTHGYSGLKRAVLGSTAEALVRRVPCPLLVVGRRVICAADSPPK